MVDIYYYWTYFKNIFYNFIFKESIDINKLTIKDANNISTNNLANIIDNNNIIRMEAIYNNEDISSENKHKIKFLKIQIDNNKKHINIDNIVKYVNTNILDKNIDITLLNKIQHIDILINKLEKKLDYIKNLQQYNVDDVVFSTKLQENINQLKILKTIKTDENSLFNLLDSIYIE